MYTKPTPISLQPNGIWIGAEGAKGRTWYPMICQLPGDMRAEIQKRIDAHEAMQKALLLMTLTPGIRTWLEQHDPKALEQAETALAVSQASAITIDGRVHVVENVRAIDAADPQLAQHMRARGFDAFGYVGETCVYRAAATGAWQVVQRVRS